MLCIAGKLECTITCAGSMYVLYIDSCVCVSNMPDNLLYKSEA